MAITNNFRTFIVCQTLYYAGNFVCYLIFLTVLNWILSLAPFIDEETENMLMMMQLRVHDPAH